MSFWTRTREHENGDFSYEAKWKKAPWRPGTLLRGRHLQLLLYACMDENHMFEVMRTLIKYSSPKLEVRLYEKFIESYSKFRFSELGETKTNRKQSVTISSPHVHSSLSLRQNDLLLSELFVAPEGYDIYLTRWTINDLTKHFCCIR